MDLNQNTTKQLPDGDSSNGHIVGSEKPPSTKRPRDDDSSDRLSVSSEKPPSTKRPRDDDSSNGHIVGSEEPPSTKRSRDDNDESDNVSDELLKKLTTPMGSFFSNRRFLQIFREMFHPHETLEWCAQHIIDSARNGKYSQLINLYTWVYAGQLDNLEQRKNLVPIFVKLMTAYMKYVVMYNKESRQFCIFNDGKIIVKLTGSGMDGKVPVFFAGPLRLELLIDHKEKTAQYYATLRKNMRLRIYDDGSMSFVFAKHRKEKTNDMGAISFVFVDNQENPPKILGEGSYGVAIKVMGTDGNWYVIKVFNDEKSAKEEWHFLEKVSGKHKCLQHGVGLMTNLSGYFQHFIASKYQGEIVLSDLKKNLSNKITIQHMIYLYLEMWGSLVFMHEDCGIIHGDIKPANILVGPNIDYVILIDFGIATTIGPNQLDSDSLYTWYFRPPRLLLEKLMMRKFNTLNSKIIDPTEVLPVMDGWAFFVSILASLANPSDDFLGFRSMSEDKARTEMFIKSAAINLINLMRPLLTEYRGIEFVQKVYWVLLNSQGSAEFIQVFRSFGVILSSEGGQSMYERYLLNFNKWRAENPMIARVKKIFENMVCEDPTVDITGLIQELSDLFVEIICDGADFSILGIFYQHVSRLFTCLGDLYGKINDLGKPIYCY
jgi:serine/threonine protein kinase